MQIQLVFSPPNGVLKLPMHHQRMVQGLVYQLMGPELSAFVHQRGFQSDDRTLRLFTFSRLMGSYKIQDQSISFYGPVRLIVASPIDAMLQQWASNLVSNNQVRLGDNLMELTKVEIARPKVKQRTITVQTLSPITAYSTLYRHDGSPYTCYFEPGETEFSELVSRNLETKALALRIDYPQGSSVTVKPLGRTKRSIVKYKGGIIKGYSGRFEINGPVALLQVGLDAGFGAKNSHGFGLCVLKGG